MARRTRRSPDSSIVSSIARAIAGTAKKAAKVSKRVDRAEAAARKKKAARAKVLRVERKVKRARAAEGVAIARAAADSSGSLPHKATRAFKRIGKLIEAIGPSTTLEVDLAPRSTGYAAVPGTRGTPWAMIGTVRFSDGVTYEALHEALLAIESDSEIASLIGRNRFARMALTYDGPETKGATRFVKRDWTISEIAPWETCASRASEETDPEEPGSVAERYSTTAVLALRVWIAHQEARAIDI